MPLPAAAPTSDLAVSSSDALTRATSSAEAPTATGIGALGPESPTATGLRTTVPDAETATGTGHGRRMPPGALPLSPGQDFGSRYHVIRLLGAGGMGAVYQAWDKTLEVAVAIKVIRPPESMDAEEAAGLEKRFKRELLLARKVTHKNVVRIHDLGELDGITYITMPYVQGADLATVLRREGRLAIDRAAAIAFQVASGLVAAHDAGIVHRDLKPANIMVDAEGAAMIMDFGIARSVAAGFTMTAGGVVVGTLEYMAPEQARGATVDHRADMYAFGLILRDMLCGRRQMANTTAVAELMDRMHRAPASPRTIDPSIPESIDALVTRCLQPDPEARYPRMADVLAELGRWMGVTTSDTQPRWPATAPAPVQPVTTRAWLTARLWIALGVLIALASSAWVFRDRIFGSNEAVAPTPAGPSVSLAILPFRNASNDATLDSVGASLSDVLRSELGQSAQIRAVSSDRVHQVLRDLRLAPNATLTQPELLRVAEFTNARRVLWGQVTTFGEAVRIEATMQDLDTSTPPTALTAMAASKSSTALLAAISELAGKVREDLARGAPDLLAELTASAWKPSTTSFDALRLYNEGVLLTQQGTHLEARRRFEEATKLDSDFALAFSALARSQAALGHGDAAVKSSRQAMTLGGALPPQEKYVIQANHYIITNDLEKAISAYEQLVKTAPNNATTQFDLGGLYEQLGNLEQSQQAFEAVVKLDPKFVEGLLGLGRVKIRRRNYQGALEHLNAAQTLAITLQREEASANILHAIGIAYRGLDRLDEALKNYEASLAIKRRLGDTRGMASSLGQIAQVQEFTGKPAEAERTYREALALQRQISDQNGLSVTLVNLAGLLNENLGRPDDALVLLKESLQIRRDAGNPAAIGLVLNHIGNVYLAKGDYSEAQTYFENALELREKVKNPADIADTVHNLGETFSKRGQYDAALKYYVRALDLRRTAGDERGAAIESYGIGTILDSQGSFGRAVQAKTEALKALRSLKQRDVWLAEVLSGLGQSLTLAGRMPEASPPFDEALALARELKNPNIIAQTLRLQSDQAAMIGDVKLAASLAEQALQAASKGADRSLTLLAESAVAVHAAATLPTRPLAAQMQNLAVEAEKIGLRSLAVEMTLHHAATLLKLDDRAGARDAAERALTRAETMGFRLLRAKAHYLRAELLRMRQDASAPREYAVVKRILDEIKAEDGSGDLLNRADLRPIYAATQSR